MIRNVSIVSLFARFLRNPQISPILPHHHSGEITLLVNALFLTTHTRTPPPTRRPTTTRKRSQENESEPLFYNRLPRKRTAVGWCENPPHEPVRRVRRIGRSKFPCGSPTIARHPNVTRLKSTAVSGGTRGLSRGSISFRILSTFFIYKALVCAILNEARATRKRSCPLKRKVRKKRGKEKLFLKLGFDTLKLYFSPSLFCFVCYE